MSIEILTTSFSLVEPKVFSGPIQAKLSNALAPAAEAVS